MYAEVRRIRSLIKSCFNGPAWHGPAILETLEKIEFKQIGKRIDGSHNIIELIHHIASWELFVIKKLEGDAEFDVVGDINWQKINQPTLQDWENAKNRLIDTHDLLMNRLKTLEDAVLLEGVPGRSYNFFYLLTGIVNHSMYHLGQILMLMKIKE